MDLRKKQQQIRNEKFARQKQDVLERERIDPYESKREESRLLSNVYDPYSAKVKDLVAKRVQEYKKMKKDGSKTTSLTY